MESSISSTGIHLYTVAFLAVDDLKSLLYMVTRRKSISVLIGFVHAQILKS